ncbi:MAG: CapA family protein [Clostridia bacterium]|nr:CapA family protein [Clostridia bacterium]
MKKRKRGVSLGTVVMILITLAVSAGCFMIMPKLSGGQTVQVDAQQVVSALTQDLNLPQLRLADIPIFQGRKIQATVTPSAPPLEMETLPLSTPQVINPVTAAPTATPAPQEISFTITAGGTVSLTAPIRKSAYHAESDTYDFSELLSFLSGETTSDLCMLTLENTLDDASKLSDVNLMAQASESLLALGVDLVSLGFPKALDTGLPALVNTLAALRQEGFSVIGAYTSQADAQKPLILNLKGAQVAVLHYTEDLSSKGDAAAKKNDAAYAVPLLMIETVQRDIAVARQNGAQVVILSLNWGSLDKTAPTKAQKSLAQQLADAGADVILGAHSQTIQPVEYLTATWADGSTHQTLVAYSLGALMTESRDTKNIAGMLLHLGLTYHPQTGQVSFDRVEYTPTYIWRYKEDGQYQYRTVASDQPAPEDMDESQQKVMARILNFAHEALETSPIEMR